MLLVVKVLMASAAMMRTSWNDAHVSIRSHRMLCDKVAMAT